MDVGGVERFVAVEGSFDRGSANDRDGE